MEVHTFAEPEVVPVSWEFTGSKVPLRQARAFRLPEGRKDLRLALDQGLVAVLTDGEHQRVLWADAVPRQEALVADEVGLVLLNPTGEERHFSVLLLPEAQAPATLALMSPWERVHASAGTARLRVDPGETPSGILRGARRGGARLAAGR